MLADVGRRYVLEQILSGEATETVVENIHEYLTTIGEQVRGGKIKLDEFIIHKVRVTPIASPNAQPTIGI